MTNKKSTKRALLTSIMAMLLCCSMLVGTTFAWFTDTVTSTNNIIKSGTLDIGLEYYDGDSWEAVTDTTNVFKDSLWEPGHTEVVYLKVSNLGTLALKYQLGINIVNEVESINVDGNPLRLSDYIMFDAIDGVDTPYADRAAARAAVTDAAKLSTGYTKSGTMEAGDPAQYVALVVYMPEDVGNAASHRVGETVPEIALGINLMATQFAAEEDSFGSDYDTNAKFDGVPAARVTVLSNMPTLEPINGDTVTLDTGYVFNTTDTYDQAQLNAHRYWHADFVATFDKDVDGADMGLAGQYDYFSEDWLAFTLDGMTINANEPVRMLKYAGEQLNDNPIYMNYEDLCLLVKEFSCGAFAVDQAAMAGTTMTVELRLYETTIDPNATSGSANEETDEYITIGTYSYTFGAKKISTVDELKKAMTNGGDYVLAADITLTEGVTVPAGVNVTLDLNGKTVSGTCSTSQQNLIYVANTAKLTIADSVGTGKITYAGDDSTGFVVGAEGNLVMQSGTLEMTGTWNIGYAVDVRTNAWSGTYEATKFTMNGGKIITSENSGAGAVRVTSSSVANYPGASSAFEMNGGEIDVAKDGIFVQVWQPTEEPLKVTVNGGTIKSDLHVIRIYASQATISDDYSIEINLSSDATLTYTGTETENYLLDNALICYGGAASAEAILARTTIIIDDVEQ